MNKSYIQDSINSFMNLIDSKYQMQFAEEYAQIGDSKIYGGKHAGSDAEIEGAKRIKQELHSIGLENVELIPTKSTRFQFNDATLTINGQGNIEIKPYAITSPGTSPEGITAELIDAGVAKKDFYEKVDVTGKIVLIEGMGVLEGASLSAQIMQAELKGAAAVITFLTEDVLNDETIRVQPMNHIPNIPVTSICMKDAAYLKNLMEENTSIEVCLTVDAEYIVDGGLGFSVAGEIPGEIDERIIFSSHLDHYFRCMQDNISSVVTLLAIAKAMIDSGYKPKRTITFVFNNSHEAGMSDSRYPYISGSYRVLETKKEWVDKTICNINFEYSALSLQTLTSMGSYELNKAFDQVLEYLPKTMEGFEKGLKPANREQYSLLAWTDSISYLVNGIPSIMNDAIHEQIYEMTSPYIGRDHSNHDNMEVFDEDALRSCTKCFGAFGIYADNMPIVPWEFSERAESIALSEDEKLIMDQLVLDYSKYQDTYNSYLQKSKDISIAITEYNEKNDMASVDGKINNGLKGIYKKIVDTFDKISPQDFITTEHSKHLLDIQLLSTAKKLIIDGQVETALNEVLSGIDIAAWSRHFDKEVVDFGESTICGPKHAHRRLWAADRELSCLTLFETVVGLEDKLHKNYNDFSNELKDLDKALDLEVALLKESLTREMESMKEITSLMDEMIISLD